MKNQNIFDRIIKNMKEGKSMKVSSNNNANVNQTQTGTGMTPPAQIGGNMGQIGMTPPAPIGGNMGQIGMTPPQPMGGNIAQNTPVSPMTTQTNNSSVISLKKGERIDLTKRNPGLSQVLIGLGWDTNKYDGQADFDLDAAAFLLDSNGKAVSESDFVFYNNPKGKNDCVIHQGDNRTGAGEGDVRHQ